MGFQTQLLIFVFKNADTAGFKDQVQTPHVFAFLKNLCVRPHHTFLGQNTAASAQYGLLCNISLRQSKCTPQTQCNNTDAFGMSSVTAAHHHHVHHSSSLMPVATQNTRLRQGEYRSRYLVGFVEEGITLSSPHTAMMSGA